MAQSILIDEFHLSVRMPKGLPERDYLAVRRVLNSNRFQNQLSRALEEMAKRHPELRHATILVSR
jgi:hypothetical protein